MKYQFLSGLSPPDFNQKPENEKYFENRAGISDLSPEGKKMMGFEKKHLEFLWRLDAKTAVLQIKLNLEDMQNSIWNDIIRYINRTRRTIIIV